MEKHSEWNREAVTGQGGKRKYEPPEIQSQEVFETTALACLKRAGQGGPCTKGNTKAT
jgi:hypothetical protein